jgi:hypothetical protein
MNLGFAAGGASVPTPTPSPSDPPPTGGFFYGFDHHLEQRRRRRAREERERQEADEIQAELDREIARLLREQEAPEAEPAGLAGLQAMGDGYAGTKQPVPRKIAATLLKAQEERTRNSLLQLQREMEQLFEEEQAAIVAALMLDDD